MIEVSAEFKEYKFWQSAVQEKGWKQALDSLMASLRDELVFDNLAVYLVEQSGERSEIAYARAVGREKRAEADADWGDEIANKVLEEKKIILQKPEGVISTERRENAYLLGLPLSASGNLLGVLSLVRFGGPEYLQKDIDTAALAAAVIAYIFEKRAWQKNIEELEKVQRQMRLQDDFVSTISHEVRTPLGFIKGYCTTLLRDDTEWDDATSKEFLTIIDEETDHLSELIDNILESARLESQTLELDFQPLRIDALIRDVITRVRIRYKELSIEFDDECTKIIRGDNTRLAQIFENLFSNAVKYAPGTKIRISIKPAKENHLRIIFSDEGSGIPQQHLPYIFDRFYRVPDQPKKAGTGLGLFICKRIVNAHRGKIWAESEEQKGTRFIIELPAE